VIWAFYLLFLAGAFTGVVQVARLRLAVHRAGRPQPPRPGSHEDLP
jgi:hypothetical protein